MRIHYLTSDLKAMDSSVPVPHLAIGSDHHRMLVLGFGTAASPPPEPLLLKKMVLDAIRLGYRHNDTSPRYLTEKSLGEAQAETVYLGLVGSRSELFITSKLWSANAHGGLIINKV
ncbi:hypothetical protein N665_0068s0012 [Sinapis alba]|nr:hypothetical protein N665_0068s0012 [Sinapis alba]